MNTYRTETAATGTLPNGRKIEITITCHDHHRTRKAAGRCAARQQTEITQGLTGAKLTYFHTAIAKNGNRHPL